MGRELPLGPLDWVCHLVGYCRHTSPFFHALLAQPRPVLVSCCCLVEWLGASHDLEVVSILWNSSDPLADGMRRGFSLGFASGESFNLVEAFQVSLAEWRAGFDSIDPGFGDESRG